MANYIVLGNYTEQGIRNIKDTGKRAEAIRSIAEKAGITIIETYWTLGQYDVILIADAPDDESMAALALSIGSLGNVRTQILPAYSADGISRILGKMVL